MRLGEVATLLPLGDRKAKRCVCVVRRERAKSITF